MNNKILIVSANYYKEISKNLELGASKTLKENGYEYEIIDAPGCFEIPYLIKKNIDNFKGFISLGCIIKGDTYHFEVIANEVSRKIMHVSSCVLGFSILYFDRGFYIPVLLLTTVLTVLLDFSRIHNLIKALIPCLRITLRLFYVLLSLFFYHFYLTV